MPPPYKPAHRALLVAACGLSLTWFARADIDLAAQGDAAVQQFTGDELAITKKREAAAKQFADRIANLTIRKIYVPDFEIDSGKRDPLGCWLAANFSKLLSENARGFAVVNRAQAHNYLDKRGWTDSDLSKANTLSEWASAFGPDAILWGTVLLREDTYTIDFDVRNLLGEELAKMKYEEQRSASWADYLPPSINGSGRRFYFAGLDGITFPKCAHCQFPKYHDFKQKKVQGAVILSVLVTSEGKTDQIRLTKSLDPDLDQRSVETVKSWRLRPAKDQDGTPVPVRIPVEISFILY